MKVFKKLLLVALLIIPARALAATNVGSVNLSCSKTSVMPGDTITCDVVATTSAEIAQIEIPFTLDSRLTVTSYEVASGWSGNDVSDGRINSYAEDGHSGTFTVGTFTFKVADAAVDGNATISFANVKLWMDITPYTGSNTSTTITIKSPYIESSTCTINSTKWIISGVTSGKTVATFKSSFTTNGTLTVKNKNNSKITSGKVCTGYYLEVDYGTNTDTYKISVLGDVNSDGAVTTADATTIATYIINKQSFTNEYLLAADITADNKVKMNDVMKIINGGV